MSLQEIPPDCAGLLVGILVLPVLMTTALECVVRVVPVGAGCVVIAAGTLVVTTMISVVLNNFFKQGVYYLLALTVINHTHVNMLPISQ